jgi:pimeloyl-ACP methyl ester carboxylesterase
MQQFALEPAAATAATEESPELRPCPRAADFRAAVAHYDAEAEVGSWTGPRYRMTYRVLGQGPSLVLVPGIASTYRTYALLLTQLAERFRTIVYDYPGEQPGDGANLTRITHDHLVDDVFALVDHLGVGPGFLAGISFGSTIALKALYRDSSRFPKTAVQGAFSHRDISVAERWALRLGRLVPGNVARLPLRRSVLAYNSRTEFPSIINDRWEFYLEQNGLTPIRSLAHRVQLLTTLDLRPVLPAISAEILLVQGNEDRIVARRYFDELKVALPHAEGVVLPNIGHQPQLTCAEVFARLIGDWFLTCPPAGCPLAQECPHPCEGRTDPESSGGVCDEKLNDRRSRG